MPVLTWYKRPLYINIPFRTIRINFARVFDRMLLKNLSLRLFLSVLAVGGIMVNAHNCIAQAVPDTSLNNIIRDDSALQAKQSRDTRISEEPVVPPADTNGEADTTDRPFQPNPKKAGLYSALLPGLGQLYNRQYWKLPVVYVGLAVAGYFFEDNLTKYNDYRTAYIGRINNPYPTDKYVKQYNTQQLQQLQDDYSKFLDLTALLSVVGYALQVMDAVTSAHLKNFDISRDISMKIRPVAMPNGIGLGLVMNMK